MQDFDLQDTFDKTGQNITDVPDDIPSHTKSLILVNCRLRQLSNLTHLTALEQASFRKNLIPRIEGLENQVKLRAIDFYDNKLARIEGLNDCTDLEYLDLSFNVISQVENVAHLTKLQELYLIENKLETLPEPDLFANRLVNLEMLELGGNRFRSLGALHLPVLTKLWVGKNKLTTLRDVNLPHLRLLSMQSNRFVSFRELPAFERLEELYMSHNGLESLADMPESIVRTLQMLDVGANRITSLTALPAFRQLSEFWFSNNKIATFEELTVLKAACGDTLEAVYAEGNPFTSSTQYRPKMALMFEQLGELDGTPLVRPNWARGPVEPITAADLQNIQNE